MNLSSLISYKSLAFAAMFSLCGCAIENDIPYPLIEGGISEIVVEGLCPSEDGTVSSGVDINKENRSVTLYVNDSVNVKRLKINRLILDPRDAAFELDSSCCVEADKFPFHDFASLDSLPLSANTRIDCSSPFTVNVKTYQDNLWKLTVKQIVERKIDVDGMVRYVLDPDSRVLVIYVSKDQDLEKINIKTLNLGGAYGRVTPDPKQVHDFRFSQTFYAARSGQDVWQEWKVVVNQEEDGGSASSSDVFAMVTKAFLKGSITSGKTPVVEYQEQGGDSWNSVSDVTTSGASFTAGLSGLKGSTTYNYRVTVDGSAISNGSFTTAAEVQLTNGSFEDWSQEGKVMNPWSSSSTPFWGTGNPGAAAFIGNLTTSTDQSVKGKAALLESKNAVIKLGAGNIFTGDFKLDGTNGILNFGRPFNSFPTALRLHYKYTSSTINRIGQDVGDLENLRGRADSCHIYIALSDKAEPYEIRTKPSVRKLFDKNDRNIIAYGEFISAQSISAYKQITIPLDYRFNNRTPKQIVVVATASKYGDYFIGGEGSTLWLDEMELVYE